MGRRLARHVMALGVSVVLLLTAAFSVSGVASAQAQPAQPTNGAPAVNSGNGLRISPVRYDMTIQPGKSQTIEINVENITNATTELRGVVNDFIAAEDESGRPRVLFDEGTENLPKHSLRKYASKIDTFKLAAKERKTIKITIAIPKDAAGGGYYGAVRFVPTSVDGSRNVNLTASIGTLVLVTVPGDVKEQLSIASMNVNKGNGRASGLFNNGKDIKLNLRFKNDGNVQVAPFGKAVLKHNGKEISTFELNAAQPRATVLPDSIRRFEIGLGDKATKMGKYTLTGNFGYGSKGQLLSGSTTFYIVPLPYAIGAVSLLALIIFCAFVIPRLIKQHDRRLIKKLRGKI